MNKRDLKYKLFCARRVIKFNREFDKKERVMLVNQKNMEHDERVFGIYEQMKLVEHL